MPRAVIGFGLLAGFYFVLTGQVSASEVEAGLPAAAAAVAWAMLIRAKAARRYDFAATPWLRLTGRTLLAIPRDVWAVGLRFASASLGGAEGHCGLVTRQTFHHGDAAQAAARRALVTLSVSLAPNSFVLDIPENDDALLLHRLAPRAEVADRDWPL